MRWRNQKKHTNFTHVPTPPPFLAATIFCVWGRTVDVIKLARFQVNRLRDFGAPGGGKWPSSIDLAHRPYTCYTVIYCNTETDIYCAFCKYSFSLCLSKRLDVMAFRNVSAAELYVHLPSRCWSNVHQNRLFQACFPIFSTVCLELAATNSSERRLSVCFKSRLNTFLFI